MPLPINLPARVSKKTPVTARWGNDVRQAISRLARQNNHQQPILGSKIFPPFWVFIQTQDNVTWSVFMQPGYVIARDNKTGDSVTEWEPTSLPLKASPLTVSDGTKIWLKVSEDSSGIVTAAEIGSGSAWVESIAPVLVGGDNGGTEGEHYVHLAEIAAHATETDILIKTQINTGNIDYFQPALIENLISSPSTGEARLMKEWNAAEGRWDFRYAKESAEDYGVTLEEDGDQIVFDTKGANLDMEVYMFTEVAGEIFDNTFETALCWRKGLFVGAYAGTRPDHTGDLVTQIVSKYTP